MASLKWIRIETCLLSDQKIEQLYQMPSGRRMVLIWILIICLAGKSNQRGCLLCGKEPYTVKMMANSFRESETFLKKTLQIFLKLELLGYENGTYFIPNWEKHQSEDKLEKQRENNRLRQQNFRERQREKILETSRYRNVTVTPQNKNKKENKNNIYNNLINNPSPSLDNMVEQDISNEHNPVYEETNPTVQPTPDRQPRTSVPTTTPLPPLVRGGAEERGGVGYSPNRGNGRSPKGLRPLQEDDLCVVPHSNPLNKKREGTEALPYDNTQAIPVGNDLCVVPHVTPINQTTLPPALTQIITNYCALLPPQDNPAETLTMLHAWLSTLQEKNRLPTTYALQLILQKLPQMAKQSHLSPPEYIQEVICRGWQSFYPVPQFGTPKPAQKEPRSRSYDIDELEAMI